MILAVSAWFAITNARDCEKPDASTETELELDAEEAALEEELPDLTGTTTSAHFKSES